MFSRVPTKCHRSRKEDSIFKPIKTLDDEVADEILYLEYSGKKIGDFKLLNQRKSQLPIGKEGKFIQVDDKSARFKAIEGVYKTNSILFTAINKKAQLVASEGLFIETKRPDIEDAFNKLVKDLNLNYKIEQISKQLMLYGNCYVEVVRNALGNISGLVLIDPKSVVIEHNEFGDISNFFQKTDKGQFIELGTDNIIFFRINETTDGVYGIGMVEPLWRDLTIYENIQDGTANYVYRKGFPKWVLTLGDANDPNYKNISKTVIDSVGNDLIDIDNRKEFVVPWWYKFSTIDGDNSKVNLSEYQDVAQKNLTMGLSAPKILMGIGEDVNYASSRAIYDLIKPEIRQQQNIILRQLNDNIFGIWLSKFGLTTELTEITFNELDFSDQYEESQMIVEQYNVGLITREFAQQKLGYTPEEMIGEYKEKPEPSAFPMFQSKEKMFNQKCSDADLDSIDSLEDWIGWSHKNSSYLDIQDDILAFIKNYGFGQITDVNKTQVGKIRKVFESAFAEGFGIRKITKELEPIVKDEVKAKAIARTEAIRIANDSAIERFERLGVKEVTWDATNDSRTCVFCRGQDGSRYPLVQASQSIPAHVNCRCSWTPVK